MPRLASQGLFAIARPLWNAETYLGEKFADLWSLITLKERLGAENLRLREEVAEAHTLLQSLNTYKRENAELKIMLGRSDASKKILAVILAKPNRSLYDTLMLDAGERNGVRTGDTVMAGDFLIGSIRETYPNYSKATLLSSPGEAFSVRIGNGIQAEALGRGGGNFIAKLPKGVSVNVGDVVTLPSLTPRYFGVVERVEQTETSSFQFILFTLPVNLNLLNWVEIVKQ